MAKITGYINLYNFFPCQLVFVCLENEKPFVVFPNGDRIDNLIGFNQTALEKMEKDKEFIFEKDESRIFHEGDVAYLFSSGEVFVGDKIRLEKRLLAELENFDLPMNEREAIVDFMRNTQT
jgi:hypothetical protein